MTEDTRIGNAGAGRLKTALFATCAALLIILYLPVLKDLVKQWIQDPNYRHGLIIPFIILFMLKRKAGRLRSAEISGNTAGGAVLIAAAALLLIAGTASSELLTTRFSFVLLILGSMVLLAGTRFVRTLAAEFILMFLMLPLPYIIYYKLTFPLQLLSARLSSGLLSILQVSIIRKGNVMILPGYKMEVVAACSGLRSVMTMITLSVVIAAFSTYSNRRKALLVALAVPAAVAANVFRLTVTALGAYLVGPSFADGILHQISGMIVFGAGLLILIAVNGMLRWKR